MVVHNLPYAAAPFVNRVIEIAEITHRLNSADCRLLTLIGPGGIGKTRLAIRVAAEVADHFDDGVYFVPLQPLDSPEFIISAIADVIRFPFSPGVDPQQQLFQYLREKALLLVLDNFEHLLSEAELLSEILEAAPEIKLLVTSREVLNLREEWLYSIHGLHYPETDDTEQPEAYSAVQLFVERARHVRRNLSVADEQAWIIHICRLVEGMPLALELAAGWTKTLPTNEVATEIRRSLDFLSTSLRNVPQRHQSMHEVFEQTWQRLSDEEQRVFRALSVFSGGFRREAAQAVAGVSTRILSDLTDKSLLTREPDGRYQIHGLLRQYAQARLEAMPDEKNRIHNLHSDYYARFLNERDKDLNGHRQRQSSLEIKADLDNIRAAWSWAVEHSRIDNIDQSEHPLLWFYLIQTRFADGADAFEKAAQMLDKGDPRTEMLLARVICDLGWMCTRRGMLEKARTALERSWLLYSQHDVLPAPRMGADPRLPLSMCYIRLGNYSAGATLLQDVFRDYTLREDRSNLPLAYFNLSTLTRVQGKYEEARRYAQQGYACTVTTGDAYIGAYCLQELGTVSQLLGDAEDAKRHLQAAYAIQKDFGDPKGMAITLISLGRVASLEGDKADAKRCYEQAWALYHDLGDNVGLVSSLLGMGNSARTMGHYGEARRYLHEALQISSKYIVSLIPSLLVESAELFLQTGQGGRGLELLAVALHHPTSDHDTKVRAQRLLSRYQATTVEVAQRAFTQADLDAVTTALLYELQILEERPLTHHTSHAGETLIEPLSEREVAVLILIADGLSNREVAGKLSLSVATVKWYLTHVYGKLGVEGRDLAILRARELNLLP